MSGCTMALIFACVAACLVAAEDSNSSAQGGLLDDASSRTSDVFDRMWDDVDSHLHHRGYQWAYALVGLVLGGFMCVEGEHACKYILIAIAAIFAFVFAFTVMQDTHPEFQTWLNLIVSAECAALVAFVSHKGYRGFRKLVGFSLGTALFYYVRLLVQYQISSDATDNASFVLTVGNMCILSGLYFFVHFDQDKFSCLTCRMRGHKKFMAVFMSIPGAALVASALYFYISILVLKVHKGPIGGQEAPDGTKLCYVDFLASFCYAHAESVGMFVNTKWKINAKNSWGLDRIIGRAICLLLFIGAVKLQLRLISYYDNREKQQKEKEKEQATKEKKVKKDDAPPAVSTSKKGSAKTQPLLG